jgi:hypothetical protein
VSGQALEIEEALASQIDNAAFVVLCVFYILFTGHYFLPAYLKNKHIANNAGESPLQLKGFEKGDLDFYKFELGTNVFF